MSEVGGRMKGGVAGGIWGKQAKHECGLRFIALFNVPSVEVNFQNQRYRSGGVIFYGGAAFCVKKPFPILQA